MKTGLTLKQKSTYAQIIRQNYCHFYESIAACLSIPIIKTSGYSSISASDMEWPNIIYDLCFEDTSQAKILDVISKEIAAGRLPRFLLIDHFTKPEGFDAIAKEYGMRPFYRWSGMIFSKEQPVDFQTPADFRIIEITNKDDLGDWIDLTNAELFTNQGIDKDKFETVLHDDKFKLYLGYSNWKPVSTLMLFTHSNVSGIYMACTLKAHTRRGFMTSMANFALARAFENESKFTILGSTRQSYELYKKIGFKDVCIFDVYWKSQ